MASISARGSNDAKGSVQPLERAREFVAGLFGKVVGDSGTWPGSVSGAPRHCMLPHRRVEDTRAILIYSVLVAFAGARGFKGASRMPRVRGGAGDPEGLGASVPAPPGVANVFWAFGGLPGVSEKAPNTAVEGRMET
jgi:hypothetical protein